MTRYLLAASLTGIITAGVAPAAIAQHTAPAGAVSSGSAVPSGSSSSGSSSSSGGTSSTSSTSSSSGSSSGNSISDGSSSGSGRRRGNVPASGTAVPRVNNPGGTITIGAGGFYPWGYVYGGGLGIYDGFYGGYYGAYDPWYGFSPVYAPSYTSTSTSDDSGAIRLKVKPSDASVYVDGYYAGVVDDFDGAFQRLHLEPGPHHIEFRATGYVPLSLDVLIQPDFTISYRGGLTRR